MIAVLGALFGLFSNLIPEVMKMMQDKKDKDHELAIMESQAKYADQLAKYKMEEIGAYADVKEAEFLGERVQAIGIHWIDSLNGSVRPVLFYAFFALYASIKLRMICAGLFWHAWSEFDEAIFSAVVTYYFGQRAFNKVMGRQR